MVVDLGAQGAAALEYELVEHLPDRPGCEVTVELYRPLDPFELREVTRAIERNVRWVAAAITLWT
jgi:hypothetical protein